jgi:site-specific recombinase XerD
MKAADLVEKYIAYKRSLGMRYETQANKLRQFSRKLGFKDVKLISPEAVRAYLDGSSPLTTTWHHAHSVLNGFFQYAIARGHVESSPLPTILPKGSKNYAPSYIYSVKEIKALLRSTKILNENRHLLRAWSVITFRTLLLLLYGAGLRLSEALSLRIPDVDLSNSLLVVRNTKFYKSRFVPIGPKLTTVLRDYFTMRQKQLWHPGSDDHFFLNYLRSPLRRQTAERYFRFVRQAAGIRRSDGAHYQPRLHDLRSSFAVHRLVAWYQQGANVQKLLPQLSTYLGHVNVADTEVYLRMTPELLREANLRFERYALSPEVRHAR